MTTTTRPVRRETYTNIRESGHTRPLMIELHPTYVRIRLKGKRHFYTATYDQIWMIGVRNMVEEQRRLKMEKKKALRKRVTERWG